MTIILLLELSDTNGRGYEVETGVTATAIGSGLSNTNSLIEMNLQPSTSGWYVVWDKIKEFRQSHSSNWFLPSRDELNLIYEARSNLSNLSISVYPWYWSSSEESSANAWFQYSTDGSQSITSKLLHYRRSRLCRYTTDSELDNPYEKKVWTTNEIITAIELNRIENRINELYSSYEPHEWSDGEIITSEKLNNIETQLETDKTWENGEIITEEKLNNIEDHLVS